MGNIMSKWFLNDPFFDSNVSELDFHEPSRAELDTY